jgi:micrococcal nuclease
MYIYKVKSARVIDGDSVQVVVDLGFYIDITIRVRFAGINTPELNSPILEQRQLAQLAKSETIAWFDINKDQLILHSKSVDKYGRHIGRFENWSKESINDILLEKNLAVKYL